MAAWVDADGSDGVSLVSDHDATFNRQQSVYSTVNGGAYSSGTQMRQAGGGGSMSYQAPMRMVGGALPKFSNEINTLQFLYVPWHVKMSYVFKIHLGTNNAKLAFQVFVKANM